MDTAPKNPLQIIVRILIILGLVILLFLLSFGIIKLVPKAFSNLNSFRTSQSNLFPWGKAEEKMTISSEPAAYTSGDEGVITWAEINGNTDGYYTFKYSCNDDGTKIEKVNDGSNRLYDTIECEKPFIIGDISSSTSYAYDDAKTFPIRVITSASTNTSETITISHRKPDSGDIYAESSTVINIYPKPEEAYPTSPSPSQTSYKPSSSYAPAPIRYESPADLSVRITQVGTLDAYNRFIPTNSSNPNDRVAVKFQVTNIGGRPSGSWRFTAYLPTNIPGDQIYYSGYQSSISAGKTSYFTIGFYAPKAGSNEFRVIVDSQNSVPESSESNNQASIYINASNSY